MTGTVTYRERIALPPTAVLKVQLAFEIIYDPARIESNHSYAVITRGAPVHVDMVLRSVGAPRR